MAAYGEGPDELFQLRNSFWVGSFQAAIDEARSRTPSTDGLRMEQECFLYRALIAKGEFKKVLDEVDESSASVGLSAVRLLAQYLADPSGTQEGVSATMKAWEEDANTRVNPILNLICSQINLAMGRTEKALELVTATESLGVEHAAMRVQILLALNRPRLAAAAVEDVKAKDEDAALNTLAAAWLVLHDGSEDHVEDCYFSLQELCDQFGQTAMLLTLMGSCKMLLGIGAMSDAIAHFKEALGLDPRNVDALANIIVAQTRADGAVVLPSAPRGKGISNARARYLAKLREIAPQHPLILRRDAAAGVVGEVAAK